MRFTIAAGILLTQAFPTVTEEATDPQNRLEDFLQQKQKKEEEEKGKKNHGWQQMAAREQHQTFESEILAQGFGGHTRRDGAINQDGIGRLTNKKFPTTFQPCDPNNIITSDESSEKADVGILGSCGDHQYCMESIYSIVGGFCDTKQEDHHDSQQIWLDEHTATDHRDQDEQRMLQGYYNYNNNNNFFSCPAAFRYYCSALCDTGNYTRTSYVTPDSYNVRCIEFYSPVRTSICTKSKPPLYPYCTMTYAGQDCTFCYGSPSNGCVFFDCSNVQGPYQQGMLGRSCLDVERFYRGRCEPFFLSFFEQCNECPSHSTRMPCSACPNENDIITNPTAMVGMGLLRREDISCGELETLGPMVAFYNFYMDEDECTDFQNIVASRCGCEPAPTSQPTGSVMPSTDPTFQPSKSFQPSTVPSSVPTTSACSERGSDITCLFNEQDDEERRTTICIREIDEGTGFYRFRNVCWKNSEIEGLVPGDPITILGDEDENAILFDCGCCDTCDVYGTTHLPIRNLRTKHCRRPAICTPGDDDWEVCFAWGNGIVQTIKVCITHKNGTDEEVCVDPFFIPSHASDIVSCGGCTASSLSFN